MQHHTCCRHWLNTTAGGIAVSLHLTVPVLHVIQLDIFYLFAAAPTVLLPALVYLSHSSPTACLASQPYLLRCLPYYTSPLFVQTTKSALVHHAPRLRILPSHRQLLIAVADSGRPYLTTHPTLRLNIGPLTAAVASCQSSDFSLWRAVNPV